MNRNYPRQTNHERPTQRKFYIWRDTTISYHNYRMYREGMWELHPWRWCCSFCEPPATGMRVSRGAYAKIIATSMPQHFQHRLMHHQWARSKPCR